MLTAIVTAEPNGFTVWVQSSEPDEFEYYGHADTRQGATLLVREIAGNVGVLHGDLIEA